MRGRIDAECVSQRLQAAAHTPSVTLGDGGCLLDFRCRGGRNDFWILSRCRWIGILPHRTLIITSRNKTREDQQHRCHDQRPSHELLLPNHPCILPLSSLKQPFANLLDSGVVGQSNFDAGGKIGHRTGKPVNPVRLGELDKKSWPGELSSRGKKVPITRTRVHGDSSIRRLFIF